LKGNSARDGKRLDLMNLTVNCSNHFYNAAVKAALFYKCRSNE